MGGRETEREETDRQTDRQRKVMNTDRCEPRDKKTDKCKKWYKQTRTGMFKHTHTHTHTHGDR